MTLMTVMYDTNDIINDSINNTLNETFCKGLVSCSKS